MSEVKAVDNLGIVPAYSRKTVVGKVIISNICCIANIGYNILIMSNAYADIEALIIQSMLRIVVQPDEVSEYCLIDFLVHNNYSLIIESISKIIGRSIGEIPLYNSINKTLFVLGNDYAVGAATVYPDILIFKSFSYFGVEDIVFLALYLTFTASFQIRVLGRVDKQCLRTEHIVNKGRTS